MKRESVVNVLAQLLGEKANKILYKIHNAEPNCTLTNGFRILQPGDDRAALTSPS